MSRPYDPAAYGEAIAAEYDTLYPSHPHGEVGMIDLLAELAGDGPALELGIGTGRVALPLTERGVEVHGIDASAAMVERLRAKPGGDRIPVTIGDFGAVEAPSTGYTLVFVPFNTFFALPDQEAQVRCMGRAAEIMGPGGRFLVDAFVPDPTRFDRGQRVQVTGVNDSEVRLDVSEYDAAGQTVRSNHVVISDTGNRFYPVDIRFAWPSELDLMARLAGMTLEQRWSDWRGTPFTGASTRHVSAWRLA